MLFTRLAFAALLGVASAAPSLSLNTPTIVARQNRRISSNGRCGSDFGNTRCPGSNCCSIAGYCGTSSESCRSPGCQRGFGRCDADVTPSGASTSRVSRPKIGNVPYGQTITSCTTGRKHIALTFDDGPYSYTADLLDLLKSYNFKATFFVTGINLSKGSIDQRWSAVIRRAAQEGHQIAHHTWSHANLNAISPSRRNEEMIKNEMALRNILGKFPTYMRPPYGECSGECLTDMGRLGYHVIKWDQDTNDWMYNTRETIQESKNIVRRFVTRRDANNWLPLLHDTYEQTVFNLSSYTFDSMVRNGWTSTTVGNCLGDPERNWYRSAR